MSSPRARAALAVARLEARESLALAGLALLLLAAMPALPWLISGDPGGRGATSTAQVILLLPLLAAALAGPAVAGERAQATWSFLLARPMQRADLLAVKAGVRLVSWLALAAATLLMLRAWLGAEGLRWLEILDAPLGAGLRLAALLGLACFAGAFLLGTKLDDPLTATLGGSLAGVGLVALVLLPGVLLGGSLREALALSPSSWSSAREIREGRGAVLRTAISPRGSAIAMDVSSGDGPSRAAVVFVEGRDRRMIVSDPLLLPSGTEIVGWQDGTSLQVRWPNGLVRAVDLAGRTSRPTGPALPPTAAIAFASVDVQDGVVRLHLRGVVTPAYPRRAPEDAP